MEPSHIYVLEAQGYYSEHEIGVFDTLAGAYQELTRYVQEACKVLARGDYSEILKLDLHGPLDCVSPLRDISRPRFREAFRCLSESETSLIGRFIAFHESVAPGCPDGFNIMQVNLNCMNPDRRVVYSTSKIVREAAKICDLCWGMGCPGTGCGGKE